MDLIKKFYTAWTGNAPVVVVTAAALFAAGVLTFWLRSGFVVTVDIGDIGNWGGFAFGLLIAGLLVLVYLGWQFDDQPGRTITIAVLAAVAGGLINALFDRAMNGGWLPIWAGLLLVTFAAASYAAWRVQARLAVISTVLPVYGMAVTALFVVGVGTPLSPSIVLGIVAIGGYTLSLTCAILDRLRPPLRTARREMPAQTVTGGALQSLRPALVFTMSLILIALPLVLIGAGPIRSIGLLVLIGALVSPYTALVLSPPLLAAWQDQHEIDERDHLGRRKKQ
ncbi:MAG: hypothetical protein HY710_09890 [Candidatus Latescibacteria bacterium]|nr:hypothetical protein [Candidatus Latescibacterota bacterium]